jgi:sulfonate transport system permease protein
LPPISKVISSFAAMLTSGQIINDISVSLLRVLKGYSIAVAAGITLGILMGTSKIINKSLLLTLSFIRQIPIMAWIPMIILWFGIGEESKVVIIIMGTFFPILLNTIGGINQISEKYIEVGKVYKLSRWRMFTKIYLPSAVPSIFVGLKLTLGIAWMVVVAAELIASSSGIGFRINDARSLLKPDVVIVGMFTIGIVGILMDHILGFILKCLTPWKNNS